MNLRKLAVAILLAATPMVVYAGPGVPHLPEPETLALLGIGAVALCIARWRNRK